MRKRAVSGKAKYGVTMERDDLTIEQWLIHLQEELMDASIYVQRLIEEVDSMQRMPHIDQDIVDAIDACESE